MAAAVIHVSTPGLMIPLLILAAVPFIVVGSVILKYRYRLTLKTIAALLAGAAVATGVMAYLATPSEITITVSNQSISIAAPLNPGITVGKDDIEYIVVENPIKSGLNPAVRTVGTAMGNLLIGWFKLSNGANAYIAATNIDSQAIVIKERNGTYVIIATPKLNEVINALRSHGYGSLIKT